MIALTDALREDPGAPGPVRLAVAVLAADQLVAGAAGVRDAAPERLQGHNSVVQSITQYTFLLSYPTKSIKD